MSKHLRKQKERGDSESISYIGTRQIWGGEEPFGLSPADRRQHVYCIGQTGTGKSTLLRNLILQDIYAGRGVGLIDPHGDLAEEVLDHIPSWRTEDVVYFNPADLEYPIGFNLLQDVPRDMRHRVASGIVGAMKSIWHDSWGPRMEYILAAAVTALLDCQNTSILGLPRMLVDRRYRQWVVRQVKDPVVRSFWMSEFEGYDQRFLREAIAPIQNKVGQLLMAAPIRNVLGQVTRKIDPRFMMDNQRVFVANLSKGSLAADKANLLGSFLVTSFEMAALSRVDVPEEYREDFSLYIDEFQNFSTESFASALSEARKYRLNLTLAHQYIEQVPERVRHAIFGNVGTTIAFRVGERDSGIIASHFGKGRPAEEFSGLSNHQILVKHLNGGRYQDAFVGKTLPPLKVGSGRREGVVRRSREKYSGRRDPVEEKINRWIS